MSETILETRNINRIYNTGSHELHVLKDVTFEIKKGETVSIVGPSGSGKSTLLGITAGLDEPSSGEVFLCGKSLKGLSEDDRALLRGEQVGFIFQSFQLLSTLSALENVMVPIELRQKPGKEIEEKARALLKDVGLGDRMSHYPTQLSGGEQQRVAIARAFINEPQILFADEPTGNLDSETGIHIEEQLFNMNKKYGTTLILVTHDNELAQKTERIIRLKGGVVVS
ncbi:MAG: ABC transporter ATP-binding protein [Lentisphaeraceae bacterium]|nr:ABC transporter ATP-binding protein [Lentisphaeraceae bacterium]